MQKVVIVTDSISCLTGELLEQYHITVVPVRLLFQCEVYLDSVDITASLLNIRPTLSSSSGLIRFVSAVRNKEQGINGIIQLMEEKVGQAPVRVAVMHAYAPDEAERLNGRLLSKFNCAELWITEFSPVMGYACGTGAVGFAFLPES